MKRFVFTILLVILLTLSSCASSGSDSGGSTVKPSESSPTTAPNDDADVWPEDVPSTEVNVLSWSNAGTETVHLSEEGAQRLLDVIRASNVVYDQADLYDLDECQRRMDAVALNISHPSNPLDPSLANLEAIVKENNERYMQSDPMLVELPDDVRLHEVCEVIVQYIPIALERMEAQGIDIDRERVYCTLSDLKIIEKPGMLDFATVTKDGILYISENSADILMNMYGDTAYRDTLVHETMHMIQIGCPCEKVYDWERRAGIAYSYPAFSMNSLDWSWYPEGVAEHTMSLVTGDEPITYASYLQYLRTFHLVTIPDTSSKAHAVDAIGFESDPRVLFSVLSDDVLPETEMLSMMTSLRVVLDVPDSFISRYQTVTGTDLSSDDEAYEAVMYSMEADVCATLAKCFYVHIGQLLSSETEVTAEDLAFLLNLFESSAERHLRFTKEEYSLYNSSFIETYTALRESLFDTLVMADGTDFSEFYASYRLMADSDTANASFAWLDADGRDVLFDAIAALEYTSFPKVP